MVFDLILIIPVYNEVECVVGVIDAWHNTLSDLGTQYHQIVLKDRSTDGTRQALALF